MLPDKLPFVVIFSRLSPLLTTTNFSLSDSFPKVAYTWEMIYN